MDRLLLGFKVSIHWSVVLVPFIIGVAGYVAKMPIDRILILIMGLPLSILIHELTHCVVARKMGIKVKEIEMSLYGCCAEIELEKATYKQEALISLSAPLASVSLSLLLYPLCNILSALNFLIAFINLIPAYPLDGGRAFKAYLVTKYPSEKAKKIILYPTFLLIGVLFIFGLYKMSKGSYLNGIVISSLGAYIFSIIYEEKIKEKKRIGCHHT